LPRLDWSVSRDDFKHESEYLQRKHHAEWLQACQNNKPDMAMARFACAGPLTETVLLGCVAMRAGEKIEWDGPNMRVTNCPKANDYLRREYRKGWSLLEAPPATSPASAVA
jgi:hypothetical protein